MSEMVKRVEVAIGLAMVRLQNPTADDDAVRTIFDLTRESYEGVGRAAIAAMREPTEAMVEAGDLGSDDDILGLGNRDPDPGEIWRAMNDAALEEPTATKETTS